MNTEMIIKVLIFQTARSHCQLDFCASFRTLCGKLDKLFLKIAL